MLLSHRHPRSHPARSSARDSPRRHRCRAHGSRPARGRVRRLAVHALGCESRRDGRDDHHLGVAGRGSGRWREGSRTGSAGSFSSTMKVGSNGLAFSACMRSHGVPNFPDPNGTGRDHVRLERRHRPELAPVPVGPEDAARSCCPNGGAPSPAQHAKAQAAMLRYSACMRSHGVPKFPDPNFSGGRISLSIDSKERASTRNRLSSRRPRRPARANLPGKLGETRTASAGGGKTLGSVGGG